MSYKGLEWFKRAFLIEHTELEKLELKKILVWIGVVTITMVIVTSFLGITNMNYMKKVVKDQFNEEQLVLARMAAHRIEKTIHDIIMDITMLNTLPAVQYATKDYYNTLFALTLPMLKRDFITEIVRVDNEGRELLNISSESGIIFGKSGLPKDEPAIYLSWARDSLNKGKVICIVGKKTKSPDRYEVLMDVIIPTYEESVDMLHPYPSRRFYGYLKATINVTAVIRDIVSPIKSGKTGYAWVIDNNGIFLYHPEPEFVGEDAFSVRTKRNPQLSFVKINEIQKRTIMNGEEGTGSYISGWHREIVEPMEKLIAYSPVRIESFEGRKFWSVAVVAPVYEIEGIVSSIYRRQILFQGMVVSAILLASLFVIIYELRWLTILEREVNIKTEDLRKYAVELEKSELKYKSLVESAEDFIFTVDSNGMIRTANSYMKRFLNVPPDEDINGLSIDVLFNSDRVPVQLDIINKVIATKSAVKSQEFIVIGENKLWFHMQYIPLSNVQSDDPLALVIGRDITDWKKLEAQLINTEKLASIGTLAAGIAHEINNPLGIILGFCELLLERFEPGTVEYNDLKTIERHGLHCKGIVERLLSFARFSEDVEEYCDVNESIMSILSVVNHTLEMNNIQLECKLSEELPLVRGDSRRIQQVLLNLINNAIHAMRNRDKKILKISTKQVKDGFVEIAVLDTGCGIPKNILPRIFDPFFTTKNVGEGTGLGLSVSYGIVRQYGGFIECESVTEDENPDTAGTTFRIYLPLYGS